MTDRTLWGLTSLVLFLTSGALMFGLSTYTINPATEFGVGMTATMAILTGLRAISINKKA